MPTLDYLATDPYTLRTESTAFIFFLLPILLFSLETNGLLFTLAESILDFSFETYYSYFLSFYSNCLV